MKITAREFTSDKLALDCKPVFGAPYTVYVQQVEGCMWLLPSGRRASRKMLDAIDRCPGVRWVDRDDD